MAQILTTTSNTAGISVTALQTAINNARAELASGANVKASTVLAIVNAYNTWIQHTHTVNDYSYSYYGLYGGSSYTTSTSSAVSAHAYSPLIVDTNTNISASVAETLRSVVNSIRSHTHSITDVY